MATTSPLTEKGRRTREAIRAAALDLVLEHGLDGVSVRMVTARAQVRPGALHYYFPSITSLVVGTAIEEIEETVAALLPPLGELTSPFAALERVLVALDAMAADDAHVLFAEVYRVSRWDPATAERLTELLRAYRDRSAGLFVELGVPAERARPLAVALAALVDGLALHASLDREMRPSSLLPVLRPLVEPAAAGR